MTNEALREKLLQIELAAEMRMKDVKRLSWHSTAYDDALAELTSAYVTACAVRRMWDEVMRRPKKVEFAPKLDLAMFDNLSDFEPVVEDAAPEVVQVDKTHCDLCAHPLLAHSPWCGYLDGEEKCFCKGDR